MLAISGTLATADAPQADAYPPRFGYANHLRTGTVAVSSEQGDFPREFATDSFTETAWLGVEGEGSWWIAVAAPGARADFCGLLLFGDNPRNAPEGLTVTLQYSDDGGSTWENVSDPVMPIDRVLVFLFDAQMHDHWRVFFEAIDPPRVADVTLGEALRAERGVQAPFQPPRQARNNRILNNETNQGHFVGRSIIRRGIETEISLSLVREAWVRNQWEPLLDHAELRPLYLVWSPVHWPDEAAFVWSRGAIPKPRYTNAAGFMEVSLPVKGIAR